MRWWLVLALLTGCRQILGLHDLPPLDAAQPDGAVVDAIDANLMWVVDVTPGGGPTMRYDLSAGPIVLDFQTSCADSTYAIVPRASFSIGAKIWGAGGGAGFVASGPLTTSGGGGGYAAATIDLVADATYTGVIGQGGINGALTTAGRCGGGGGIGSGAMNPGDGFGASGGGFGGVFAGAVDPANALLVAGGGGGATGDPEPGGAGGGTSGGGGGFAQRAGRGGTQIAGGSPGTGNGDPGNPGSALTGGASNWETDAGGGGGYFGGGSGGSSMGGAGGGGSAYCASVVHTCTYGDAPVNGDLGTPASGADPDRGVAASGSMDLTTPGGAARIVLKMP